MSQKTNSRRKRITKANHGARPASGSKPVKVKGTGKKGG